MYFYSSYNCLLFFFLKLFKPLEIFIRRSELIINCPFEELMFVAKFLNYSSFFRFRFLSDVFCVDYPSRLMRFEVSYVFFSSLFNARLRLRVPVGFSSHLSSLVSLYRSANWLEREIWDLFGVFFFDHPDLRRILTDYGFDGHPLRKDYPLSGFLELRYHEGLKRIVYEPVEFSQKYRSFDFRSPWIK